MFILKLNDRRKCACGRVQQMSPESGGAGVRQIPCESAHLSPCRINHEREVLPLGTRWKASMWEGRKVQEAECSGKPQYHWVGRQDVRYPLVLHEPDPKLFGERKEELASLSRADIKMHFCF